MVWALFDEVKVVGGTLKEVLASYEDSVYMSQHMTFQCTYVEKEFPPMGFVCWTKLGLPHRMNT
jgi:hypothetical protein